MFVYPNPDPVALSIGPIHVRWYGFMYLVGFLGAWWLARRRASKPGSSWTPTDVDDLIFYCTVGVILGGRLGWMLFYGTERILADPFGVLRIWDGGMSFHGGLIGVLAALAMFANHRDRLIADVFDFTAPLPAIGFGAGRIGNFINGELWGKPTDVPWAVIVDGVARHASQLYEAFLEGLVLFLVCYGIFRFAVEFVRVPDENRGYLFLGWVTMGQILSLPMIIAGLWMLAVAYRRREPSGNYT